MAVINGRVVQVGDEIQGYRVSRITEDRVLLTDGTHTLELHYQ